MGALRYNFDLIFANLLFGANFSFYVSLTRNYLDFQQIFMLQVLAASIFFIPFALFSKQSYRIPLRDFGNILIVTVLIVYGWMFMLLWGASYTSPIDASTISTLGPVFTILTGHFLLREKNITWARRIGVVLGFAGAAFLLFDKGFRLAPGSSGLGNALVLVAVVAIAVNTVIIKPQLQRYGTLVVMGWYYIIGLLITAPFFWKYIADTDVLRLPLEDGQISVSRAAGSATYPSRFQLVAAMNPCKCGYYGHPTRPCTCSPSAVRQYRSRVSGPLLVRIVLCVELDPVAFDELHTSTPAESSADLRKQVLAARAVQAKRYAAPGYEGVRCNAQLTAGQVRRVCRMTPAAERLLRASYDTLGLSARAHDRILRVARTVADLAGKQLLDEEALLEALQYRAQEKVETF